MPDPAHQLARLYQAGFEIQKLERFPRAIAIMRQDCIVLAEPNPDGLRLIGRAGWRLGDGIGVLMEQAGKQFFQAKQHTLEGTPERLQTLRAFESDLSQLLLSAA